MGHSLWKATRFPNGSYLVPRTADMVKLNRFRLSIGCSFGSCNRVARAETGQAIHRDINLSINFNEIIFNIKKARSLERAHPHLPNPNQSGCGHFTNPSISFKAIKCFIL